MKGMHLVAPAAALLIVVSSVDGRAVLDPAPAASPIPASGDFAAVVDFTTLAATPRGNNCLLEVAGQLVFTGTIEGAATGTTSALVFAPCSEVATSPPGTFPDVFRSELQFEGTVDGEPAQGSMLYQGRVQEGGQIEGRILLSGGVAGVLEVNSRVAVGGSYQGSIVVP